MSTHIILEFASTTGVRVTLVLGVAGLVYLIACWRRASAAHRHLIWSVALVASLCLPLFGSVLPPLPVPIPEAFRALPERVPAQSLGAVAVRPQIPRATVEVPATVIHEAPARVVVAGSRAAQLSVAQLLLALYVGGFFLLVAGIIRDHWLLSRLTREARVVDTEPWRTLLESLADRTHVRRAVKLLRAPAPVSPLTAGIIRPVIVIPSSADEWSSRRREAVLLHELAHVARHDCLTQTLAAVACALYWPHPLAWLAAARLRVDRELACDDAVLTRGIWARDYARDLLELARALSMPVPRLAVSMAGVRELEGRLRSLIDSARSRRAPSRAATSVAFAGACVAGLLAAIVRPALVAAAAPVEAPRVASRPALTVMPSPFGGQFAIRLTTPADGPENQGRVHVMLWTPGINTFYSEMRELTGLTREQLLTDGAALKFALRRDAGTLEFSGIARRGTAQGTFSFQADTSFNRALADRGIAAITPEEQFSFARHNLSLAFLDELARLGYPTPTRRELVVAATSGAELKYLREMSALGYRASSLSGLVSLSNEGVDPAFVRRLSAIGYRSLPVADLLQLRNEDIDSSFIADANARAGRKLSVGELILLRLNRSESEPPAAQPIDDDTVTTGRWMLHTLPGGMLQLDIEWANVNQWRRELRASDITELDQGRFRLGQDAGVFTFERSGDFSFAPNKGFLATLRSLGVRDADRIGIHQLKNLAFGFMSADSVKGIMEEGLAPLTLHDVVDLAVYQITPGFVRQVKAAGYEDLTLRRLVDIKMGARVSKVVGGER